MDTPKAKNSIGKTLEAVLIFKYIGLLFTFLTLVPIGIMIYSAVKGDSRLFIQSFVLTFSCIFILAFIIYIYTKRLKILTSYGIEYLDEYMNFIANVNNPFKYSEYILWFSDYIRRQFIIEDGSYKLSTLHTLTYKNNLGLCPASYHKNSFQQLLKLILKNNTEYLDDITDHVERYINTILNTEAEKTPLFSRRPHDSYVGMYILVAVCYIFGAALSAADLDVDIKSMSLELLSFKTTTCISNLLFYMPLVIAEILVHKGYIKKKDDDQVAELQRKQYDKQGNKKYTEL